MRRANGAILGILLATVAVPAFAADMPVKAAPPPPPPPDWSGIYVGGAAGFAWGRENLNVPVSPLNNLFGTSADRLFDGTPVLIQPDFDMGGCVINNCNRFNTNGFIGGGFAGAQKQWGGWVIGIEGSWDWTGMKKSLTATTSSLEDAIRIVPTTTFQVGPLPVTGTANVLPVTVSSTGVLTVPGQNITSTGTLTIPSQTIASTGSITIDGQTVNSTGQITIGGQTVNSSGSLTIPGQTVQACIVILGCTNASIGPASLQVPAQTVTVNVTGNTATATVNVVVNGATQTVTIPVNVTGQTAAVTLPVTVNGATQTVTLPVNVVGTVPGQQAAVTGTTGTQSITLPIPRQTTVRATVTRSVDVESKIDQIADIRGKIGFAQTFLGPNWLVYFTGGAAIGHFERSLTLTQTVSVAGDGTRTNTLQSTTGDTRLGWVVGAGFDWKMTPNVLLGVLYRHHEFPSGTVSFVDDSGGSGRPVSFGTSRATVDSVQGRLSLLFPIR
jgi:opacity protein-like surface antigen